MAYGLTALRPSAWLACTLILGSTRAQFRDYYWLKRTGSCKAGRAPAY
jgi:hypothetical protein